MAKDKSVMPLPLSPSVMGTGGGASGVFAILAKT